MRVCSREGEGILRRLRPRHLAVTALLMSLPCPPIVHARAAPAGAGVFRSTTVARIPYGQGPGHLAVPDADGCESDCYAGFAFIGADDALYIFDFGQRDLKRVELTPGAPCTISTIPVPRGQVRYEAPVDGAAGRDGAIYMLAERRTSGVPSFALSTRLPGEGAWKESARFDCEACGGAGGIPIHDAARLAVDADSEVVLYASDRRRDGGLTVSIYERLLPDSLRRSHPAGISLPGGARLLTDARGVRIAAAFGDTISLPVRYASLLGVDSTGTSFFASVPGRSGGLAIEAYDRKGRLLRVFVFGGGWGHGVGLCQVGARFAALSGMDYKAILSHYFSESQVELVYE